MKKLLLTIITVSSLSFLSAQEIKFGAKGGLNSSRIKFTVPRIVFGGFEAIYANKDYQFKNGFHVGGFVEFVITDQFSFQPELLLSFQGSKYESNDTEYKPLPGFDQFETVTNTTTNLTTAYINIPLMAKYYVSEKLYLMVGPQVGYLVGAKSKSEGFAINAFAIFTPPKTIKTLTIIDSDTDVKESFKSFNLSAGAGAGYFFTENIFAEARYNRGLSNDSQMVRFFNIDPDAKASAIQISLGYRF